MTFLMGGLVGNLTTGNVGIGTTSPGAKLHVGSTPGTDGIMFPDGTLQTTATGFGNWTELTLSDIGTLTVNQATTNGFLLAIEKQKRGQSHFCLLL